MSVTNFGEETFQCGWFLNDVFWSYVGGFIIAAEISFIASKRKISLHFVNSKSWPEDGRWTRKVHHPARKLIH
jgi:hypothetical protein